MKLTILGTGNASAVKRYNTCFALSDQGQHFLVDGGGGNRILKVLEDAGILLEEVHDIFITHGHIDHLLGVVWLIRMTGQKMYQGQYHGQLRIYGHQEAVAAITAIVNLTMEQKVVNLLGEQILLVAVKDKETRKILNFEITFFDIDSTKTRQFGFTLVTAAGKRLTCCGDEPYRPSEESYVRGCDWLLHEAFCLYAERDRFKPYEKQHSTVQDACRTAEELGVGNLILYHTEETHGEQRKGLYLAEGARCFSGNLYVPEDMEIFNI